MKTRHVKVTGFLQGPAKILELRAEALREGEHCEDKKRGVTV